MTRALLHIGTPKTGTTSFQAWASTNRLLLERAAHTRAYRGLFGGNHFEFGLLCKRQSRNGFGELPFPDWCLPEWRTQARNHIRLEIDRAKSAGQDFLVSSEVISLLRHDDELERLSQLLEGLETRAVAVVREPNSFLDSWRRQLGPGGWSAHPSSAGYTEPDSWLVDYPAMSETFDRAFGAGALRVVSYEEELERHGTVIPAIVEGLGIDEAASSWSGEAEWMNTSESKSIAVLPSSRAGLEAEFSHRHRRLDLLGSERDGLGTQLDLAKEESRRQEDALASLGRELLEARRELQTINLEAERSSMIIASMKESASWRLTRPGRAAKRMIRRATSSCPSGGRSASQAAALLAFAAGVAALLVFILST